MQLEDGTKEEAEEEVKNGMQGYQEAAVVGAEAHGLQVQVVQVVQVSLQHLLKILHNPYRL